MRAVAFAPLQNRPGTNPRTGVPWADATGAFQPEALRFAKVHGDVRVVLFDAFAEKSERRSAVREALRAGPSDIECVAFFCHGHKTGLQTGYDGRTGAEQLAVDLARFSSLHTVVLFACDAGRDGDAASADDIRPGPGGDGGFADLVRDELAQTFARSVTIYAHAATGHTSRLPYVRRFDYATSAGGEWVIEPDSELWKAWRRKLQSPKDDFRLTFPFMTQAELEAALRDKP